MIRDLGFLDALEFIGWAFICALLLPVVLIVGSFQPRRPPKVFELDGELD